MRGRSGHGGECMILRGRSNETRAPDINLFDGFRESNVFLLNRAFKRIQIDHYQVEFQNPVFGQGSHILIMRSSSQNSAKDLGMERFHPPVHHLRKSGVVRYLHRL